MEKGRTFKGILSKKYLTVMFDANSHIGGVGVIVPGVSGASSKGSLRLLMQLHDEKHPH